MKHPRLLVAGIGLLVLAVSSFPTLAQGPSVETKLTASDAATFDLFGRNVALSGDTAVVGAVLDDDAGSFSGSAYVFVRSGTTWSEQAKLTASDAAEGDQFGFSVAISGDTAVVGALRTNDAGSRSGSAYVFVRSGTTWTQQAKLTASDATARDFFGNSVAVSNDTAVVGAVGNDDAGSRSGSAYVFVRSGTTWTQQAKLTASDAAAGDQFGGCVAISGDTAVIGAERDNDAGTNSGSAYVFVRSGTTWTQQAKLTATDAAAGDFFGRSVAASGDTAVIGAFADDDAGSASGSAYVFVRSGTTWSEQAKLTASDGAAADFFGRSVAVSGDTAVIGAERDNDAGTNSGSAYVFVRSGTTWSEQAKLTASDAAAGDLFGFSVAVSGDTAVVGAPLGDGAVINSGAAYAFELAPLVLQILSELQAIVDSNAGTLLADKVEDAVANLETAVAELAKTPPDNQAAVGNIEGAVGDLEVAVNLGLLDPSEGTAIMNQLAGVARQLAAQAIADAVAQGGDPVVINDAQQSLAAGDGLRSSGLFKDAVNQYKDALANAESA